MQVRLSTLPEFYRVFPRSATPYGSRQFVELVAPATDAVRCFVGYDEHDAPRMGAVMGWDAASSTWLCPFSAPFAELAYDKPQSLERIYDFASELQHVLAPHNARITLPPSFYDTEMLPKVTGILAQLAQRSIFDFDYYYPLSRASEFDSHLSVAAAKNFRRACRSPFAFSPTDDIQRAYAVIKENRLSHGYSLAMSLDQVAATAAAAVSADFFVMSLDGADVAAAIAYRISPRIAQVIYWGDVPGYSHLRPMNIFPMHLFRHYASLGFDIVDVGPSSTNGIPNPGLCSFKESIGCLTALKPTFIL